MSGPRILSAAVCALLLPVIISISTVLIPSGILRVVAVFAASVLALIGIGYMTHTAKLIRLRHLRGVERAASDRERSSQFSEVWDKASHDILTWGVGMTSMSHDVTLIEQTVSRGCKVVIEMTDPSWVRANPAISDLIDRTYSRDKFADQIEASRKRLDAMVERLNRIYGEGRAELWLIQSYQAQSGTVADPGTTVAWGYVEWHTPGFPHGQARFKMRSYATNSPLSPPLLDHLLLSRQNLPRRLSQLPTSAGLG